MIRKVTILFPLVFAVFVMFNNGFVFTSSIQPPAARTAAPGETNCAGSGCHIGAPNLNSPLLEINFNNGSALYDAGATYDMSVTVNQTANKYGFQLTALDGTGNKVGTLAATGANTAINPSIPPSGREYVNHLNAPTGTNTFEFQWTAPAADAGSVTFYAAGNAANGNGNANGDMIFTNSLAIDFNTDTGLGEAEQIGLRNFPNPVSDVLNVQYELERSQNIRIALYDLAGKEVAVLHDGNRPAGVQTHVFELGSRHLASGMHLLQIEGETVRAARKILVR